jgi:hypothetical protein
MARVPSNFNPNRCEGCRKVRQKCTEERPACSKCIKRGKTCVYVKTAAASVANAEIRAARGSSTPKLGANRDGEEPETEPEPKIDPMDWTAILNAATFDGTQTYTPFEDAMNVEYPVCAYPVANQWDMDFTAAFKDIDFASPSITQAVAKLMTMPDDVASTPEIDNFLSVSSKLFTESAKLEQDEHEAALNDMYELRKSLKILSMKSVQYDDIRLSTLSPADTAIFLAIYEKVFKAIDFGIEDLDVQINTKKRPGFEDLAQEVQELQNKHKHENGEEMLVVALGALVESVLLVRDFYDATRSCSITIGKLRTTITMHLTTLSEADADIFCTTYQKVSNVTDVYYKYGAIQSDIKKRQALEDLAQEVQELQNKHKHENGEETLVVTLGTLAESVLLVRDIYDTACSYVMTIGKLHTMIMKVKEGTWDRRSEDDQALHTKGYISLFITLY